MQFRRLGQGALKAAPNLRLRRVIIALAGFRHQAKTLTRV
jgi:hypothetical protein